MDLTKPAFDSVIRIDERLKQLQGEVKTLEVEYGFSKDFSAPKVKIEANALIEFPPNETRYNKLPQREPSPSSFPKSLNRPPEIDSNWKKTFANTSKHFKLPHTLPESQIDMEDFKFENDVALEIKESLDLVVDSWLNESLAMEGMG